MQISAGQFALNRLYDGTTMPALTSVLANTDANDQWVRRDDLVERMGTPAHGTMARLTILMAPIGYGKTLLTAQWIRHVGEGATVVVYDRETRRQGSWEPSGLAVELMQFVDDLEGSLDDAESKRALFQKVDAVAAPCVIVFDEFDQFGGDVRERIIASLLLDESTPSNLWIVVHCRKPLRHPIGVLTVRGWTRFFTQEDLAYTNRQLDEIYVRGRVARDGQNLEPSEAVAERWPAAAHLLPATRSLAERARHWLIFEDYLYSEVASSFDSDTLMLLQATADIGKLSVELWNALALALSLDPLSLEEVFAIVPGDHRDEANQSLNALVRRAFRDRASIAPETRDRANDVAIAWYFTNGAPNEAWELARQTGRWNEAVGALASTCHDLSQRDYSIEILELLVPVPTHILAHHEDLAFWYIMSLFLVGRVTEAQGVSEQCIPVWHGDRPLTVGRIALLEGLYQRTICRYDAAISAGERALELLPPSAHYERMHAAYCAAQAALAQAEIETCSRFSRLGESEQFMLPGTQRWAKVGIGTLRANWLAVHGELRAARTTLEQRIRTLPEELRPYLVMPVMVLAALDLEQGDTAAALQRLEAHDDVLLELYWAGDVQCVRAMVLHAAGRTDEAKEVLYAVTRNAADGDPSIATRARTLLAQIWVDTGDLVSVYYWARQGQLEADKWPLIFGPYLPGLVLAEWRMAENDWQGAVDRLVAVIAEAERRGFRSALVRAHVLLCFAYEGLQQRANSRQALLTAVRIAGDQGFGRSFIYDGRDLREVLRFPRATDAVSPRAERGVLTEREIEVLRLVSEGLSNEQIARRMFISRFTVKNHLARIYAVLGVHNRKDSVAAAESYDLI